MLAALI